MTIAAELNYKMDVAKYDLILQDDPYSFAPANALELLSDEGHQCFFIVACNPGQSRHLIRNGVVWIFCENGHEIRREVASISPQVCFLITSPSTPTINDTHNGRMKLIQRISGEANHYTMDVALEQYSKCERVVCCFDYEVHHLRMAGVDIPIDTIPYAINFDVCDRFWNEEPEFDFVCAQATAMKGYDFASAIMDCLNREGYSIHPYRNLINFSKAEYLKELARCRYLLSPTGSEGSARHLSEAARLGLLPVVSADSQNVCYHLKDLPHIEFRSWCWVNRTLEKFCYPGDPVKAAFEIIDKLPQNFERPNRDRFPKELDVRNEAKAIADSIRSVIVKIS